MAVILFSWMPQLHTDVAIKTVTTRIFYLLLHSTERLKKKRAKTCLTDSSMPCF